MLGIPVHQSARAADFAAVGGQARAGDQVFLDRLLQPHVDIVQAAAAARRGVAALERELGVAGREDRHVFDRILDVEIGQLGHVEIRGMEVCLDQSRHDRPAAGVDPLCLGRNRRCASGRPGVGDLAVLRDDGRISDRRRAGSVHQPAVRDQQSSLGGLHRPGLINIDAACRAPIRCN